MIQIDMEMPEKCGLCPLFHAEHPMYCQGVKADRKNKIVAPYGQQRPDWCPLHEVDSDTINRRQAIDALFGILDIPNHADFLYTDEIARALNQLPPSPSRPTAEKIQDSYYSDNLVCSNCGVEARWDFEYCPYCGFKFKQIGGAV